MGYTELRKLMNSEKFESYCREMYQENCRERNVWKEKLLSYEEYQEKNLNFLLDNYSEV